MRQFGAVVELNLYTYCGNNPIIFVDPYGLGFWQSFWGWVRGLLDQILPNPGGAGEAGRLTCVIIKETDRHNRNAKKCMEGDDLYPNRFFWKCNKK